MVELGIKDFLDFLLVASLLFYVYRLMKESRSLKAFRGHHALRANLALCESDTGNALLVLSWINW